MTAANSGGDRAERIAQAVLSVLGVARLDGGRFGEVATYLPGRRVTGVSLDEDSGEVHIVVEWPRGPDGDPARADLLQTAQRVQDAAEEAAGVPITVTVEDIVAAPSSPQRDEKQRQGIEGS